MQKLLFILLLSCPLSMVAQVEFAPLGATWYFDHYSPPLPWKLAYIKVEVTGIDTIQGRACKRIESKNILDYSDWGCSFYAPLLHTFQKEGRVYAYHDGDFHLLYDFDALAGESWVIHNPPTALGDSLVVVVDSVSFVTINGQNRKVQHVSNPGVEPGGLLEWSDQIIEGIGNIGFITPQYPTCDPWIFGLRCYQDDSLDLHFVDYPCDSTKSYLATREPVVQGGLFSPNPVYNQTITLSDGIDGDRVVVQHLSGSILHSFPIPSDRRIEIGALPSGVYFASIYKEKQLAGIDKLVILTP